MSTESPAVADKRRALGRYRQVLAILQWTLYASATAIGFFALASGVVTSRRWLGVYVFVEGVLALAFLAFAALIIAANTSPSHGFSVRELLLPIVVFIAFSAGPLIVALPLWRANG